MTLILMKMKFHLQVVTKMLANRNMTTYTSTVYVVEHGDHFKQRSRNRAMGHVCPPPLGKSEKSALFLVPYLKNEKSIS